MSDNLPITISVLAVIISSLSLGWNIFRDVILKSRVKVTIRTSYIYDNGKRYGPYVNIFVTNLGPGSIICEGVYCAKKSLFRFLGYHISKLFDKHNKWMHIMHDYENPYSDPLPKKLDIGERISLLFPVDEKNFISENPTHVGIIDSFGRYHWADRKNLRTTKREYFSDYEIRPWGSSSEEQNTC